MDRFVSIAGDPHIGVFTRVFDDIAVVPPDAPEELIQQYQEALKVDVIRTTIQKSPIIGSLLAGNNHGLVITGMASDEEIEILSEYRDLMLLEEGMNAAGNVILANDSFAAVHPEMEEELMEALSEFLKVPVIPLTLGEIKTVGMAAVATNAGVVVSPRSTPGEIKILEEVCDLPVGKGTVTMGNAMVGTGLVANRHGYLAGVGTSGYELGRIEDILGFEEE
ncbi:translation initiation factor IF-6 [Methanospirillum purgamenti]|jgi:translation initiation factor 6|uniref:Translation initiation factor 6 n=1 Tax=Methanospirillum hungatei TaxID=2203 RepID=A0A8F5VI96_METHU|nr:translation initiation factor IF-6 [Methanospirillum hungatei]NLW77049.1 translation initiation factor IF-6 [Methanomicrobiales archaeon]QXO93467.1 translation initiation factor IF-6 [Methanospirillum hungatei]